MTDNTTARQAGLTDERIHEIFYPSGSATPNQLLIARGIARAIEREVLAAQSADARNGEGVALSDAEINEVTMSALGHWPSFEAQSWACKVVHAVQVATVSEFDPMEFGAELNRAYVLKVLADVEAIACDRTDAYWAGFQNAIEEVRTRLDAPAAPAPTKLDADLLATIHDAAKTRAEGAITQDGRTVFINYGDNKQSLIETVDVDCPHCGGSGHKDDVRAAPAPAAQADRNAAQLCDWLLTDPQSGEQLRFAGPLENDFMRLSRVRMESESGSVWTLTAKLEEGYLTPSQRMANIKAAARDEDQQSATPAGDDHE
jgi:hypothetical protein